MTMRFAVAPRGMVQILEAQGVVGGSRESEALVVAAVGVAKIEARALHDYVGV